MNWQFGPISAFRKGESTARETWPDLDYCKAPLNALGAWVSLA